MLLFIFYAQSGNCPVGELSGWGIVRVGNCPSGNCPGGNCPRGIVRRGIVRRGTVRRGIVRSGNCPDTKELLFISHYCYLFRFETINSMLQTDLFTIVNHPLH